jgi:hypothetical protein
MFRRWLYCGLLVVTLLGAPAPAWSAGAIMAGPSTTASLADRATLRQAIRSLPILERPDRFGHFYGNTVRRLHRLGMGVRNR